MRRHHNKFSAALFLALLLLGFAALSSRGDVITASSAFHRGADAYAGINFESAASLFREAAVSPAPGALYNLGDAEWQCNHPGPAILAWEQSQWLDPFYRNTTANLRYARKVRQLDSPELAWYEICSTWLPANWWPWLAGAGFWLAAALMMLPGIFGWRKAGWLQALAAASFAVFLLTVPALAGVQSRSRLGIILPNEIPLRLTPTADAQEETRLAAGETVRLERIRGNYLLVRTANATGWVRRDQLGFISR
jgi:hypothetical protein